MQLMDLEENVKQYTGIVHIQVKDCHHLHHKMHPDLIQKSVKLEPYVKFYVGSRDHFESSFGKSGNLKKGIYAMSQTGKIDEHRFHQQQSKQILAGHEVIWNEDDGKFIFDTEIQAIDLCILIQVFHGKVMLGQTFLEIRQTIFDSKTNRFVLKDEHMIQILSNEKNLIIPYHGDPLKKEYWEVKPFEELVKFEIPLMTLFVSFVPKTYCRPSIKVVVLRAEKLPRMDVFSGKADPFVIISLGKENENDMDASDMKWFQTDVIHNSLEPCWVVNNIFTLNLDAEQWKDETLTFVVMDHERVGAPREIGSWKDSVTEFFKCQFKKLDRSKGKIDQSQDVQFVLTNASGKNVGYLWCNISFQGAFWETTVVKEFVV